MKSNTLYSFCFTLVISASMRIALGCTGIALKAKDGSIVYGRTLEFGQDIQSQILFIPRNYTFKGATPFKNRSGLIWKSKYAALGANALNLNVLVDGVNEKGLAGGLFYFPEYA